MARPVVLQLGDDIRWNHELYETFQSKFTIQRSNSMGREEFSQALKLGKFGDFYAIYRPFWNTGGEMGPWNEELVSLLPESCKIFASAGAGFDWVDTACLARKGILYCNAAPACTESVADAAIWLILSTFRLLSWSAAAARSGDPDQFLDATRNLGAVSRNPRGHTLGIVGFGRIGRMVAAKAHGAFGLRIIYNDLVRLPPELERETEAVYYEKLDSVLAASDCVLLAAPFDGGAILNNAALAKMKPGARLVNVGRGKLVDEEALVEVLEKGRLAAAGLDVHCNEPQVNKQLAGMKNVQVTCHNAGASLDSHMGFERLGMENILNFYECGKAITPVNAWC